MLLQQQQQQQHRDRGDLLLQQHLHRPGRLQHQNHSYTCTLQVQKQLRVLGCTEEQGMRVLVGMQVPRGEMAAFRAFLAALGYPHVDESRNPAYRLFLG